MDAKKYIFRIPYNTIIYILCGLCFIYIYTKNPLHRDLGTLSWVYFICMILSYGISKKYSSLGILLIVMVLLLFMVLYINNIHLLL